MASYNPTHMVTLTDIAAEKVSTFLAGQEPTEGAGLRVGVRGGGCSGFQYALALDEQRDGDPRERLRIRDLLQSVGALGRAADAEVADGEDVRAAEMEDQEHVGAPLADAFHRGELLRYLGVGQLGEMVEIQVAVLHPLG